MIHPALRSIRKAQTSRGVLAAAAVLGVLALILIAIFALQGPSTSTVTPPVPTNAAESGGSSQEPAVILQTEPRPAQPETNNRARELVESNPSEEEPAIEVTEKGEPVEVWTGRVTATVTQEPIAGAKVMLASTESFLSVMGHGERPVALAHAETNTDGHYVIELFEERSGFRGMAMLIAEAEGFATETHIKTTVAIDSEKKGDFQLESGGTLSGWVMDEDDKPVMGAAVGSLSLTQPALGGTSQEHYSAWAESTGSGAFELQGVPLTETVRVPARAEGYMPALSESVKAGTTDLRIILKQGGGVLVGRVLDENGEGVEGIQVAAYPQPNMQSVDMQSMMAGMRTGTTNAEGGFQFTSMMAGQWMIQAMDISSGSGMMGPQRMKMESVTITEGVETEVTISFEAPRIVRGRAIDIATDKGIADVAVSNEAYLTWNPDGSMKELEPSEDRKEVLTDAEGRFELEVPNRGYGMINVFYRTPDGYIPEASHMEGMHYIQIAEDMEEIPEVELRFKKGTVVSGTVLDRDKSTPVPNASIRIRDAGGTQNRMGPKTDAEGRFTFAAEPGREPKMMTKTETGWATGEVVVPANGMPEEVEMILQPFSTISGTISDGRGEPQKAVRVMINIKDWAPQFVQPSMAKTRSDEKGYYFLRNVAGEEVQVTLMMPKESELSAPEPRDVTLKAGEAKEKVDFVLGEGDFIEGVVSDIEDNPIEGAQVSWHIWDGTPQIGRTAVETDEEGYYRIKGLKQGAVVNQISASHPEYQSDSVRNVSLLDGPQNFVLKPKGEIELTAVTESGSAVTNYEYLVYTSAWNQNVNPDAPRGRVRDERGATSLSLNGSGGMRVVVAELDENDQPTGRKGASLFTVPEDGEPVEVEVEIKTGATITGRVIMDDTEDPVSEAVVGVFVQQRNFGPWQQTAVPEVFKHRTTTTDSSGEFAMPDMVVGTYELTATADGYSTMERAEVVVEEDVEPDPVTIRVGRAGTVFGEVLDRERRPMSGIQIQYWEQSRWSDTKTVTNKDGEYRIEDLAPGTYSLTLNSSQHNLSESRSVELASGEEKEENFDFSNTIKLTGTVMIDGEPWNGQPVHFSLQPADSQSSGGNLHHEGNGQYVAYPRPGGWRLNMSTSTGQAGVAEFFELPAEPREQTRDFNITTTSADVYVELPDNVTLENGWVNLQQTSDDNFNSSASFQMSGQQKHIPMLIAGSYRGEFNGSGIKDDNSGIQPSTIQLSGQSETLEIVPGNDNVIVIFAEDADDARSGLALIQEMLNRLGYDSGPIDGIMGPMTRAALRRFQEDNGLEPDGTPTEETVALLEEMSGG